MHVMMKRFALSILLVLVSFFTVFATEGSGNVHIYRGKYANYSDIRYTWDGEHLYRGKFTN